MLRQEIISNKNKFNLWNDFNSKGLFKDINEQNIHDIKELFEKSISMVYNKYNDNDKILNVDNEILNVFNNELKRYKTNQSIKNNEINRIDDLNKLVEQNRSELDQLINPKKPEEINFENKNNDEPFKEDINDIINKTIENREKEMNEIISSLPLPEENLTQVSNDSTNDSLSKEILKSQIKIIELLETIVISNKNIQDKLNEKKIKKNKKNKKNLVK